MGVAFTKPQTHNKPPKAFKSQGHFGRPVTCWCLPKGPNAVRAVETPEFRERAAPTPGSRRAKVGCVGGSVADLGSAEPSKENSAFAGRGFLVMAF